MSTRHGRSSHRRMVRSGTVSARGDATQVCCSGIGIDHDVLTSAFCPRSQWSKDDNALDKAMYHRAGRWEISDQWLDVYSPGGTLLGAFSLPQFSAERMVIDGLGRLFIWGDDGSVRVFRDPIQHGPCDHRGPDMDILPADSPGVAPVLRHLSTS